MDYYELLGVSKDASQDDIKKAYRKLASKHHPDKGGDTSKFQEIQKAYDTLSDDNKRHEYDNRGRAGPGGFQFNFGDGGVHFGSGDMNDIMNEIFGGRFGFRSGPRGAHQQPRRNKDMRINMMLHLKDTLQENVKTIQLKTTKGEEQIVEVKIPRGIETGAVMKFSGLGDNFFDTIPRGDLYVHFTVMPDERFTVMGLDLIADLIINAYDAILGTQVEVEGLDGKKFMIAIPPGTQPNTKFRIKGEGLYSATYHGRGNLIADIHIEVPRNLSQKQLDLINEAKALQQ